MIFDEIILQKLTRLSFVAARVRAGILRGERRSVRRGAGTEFADYRLYAPGDDLRRVDWNIYARLDRPFLKIFSEEEDLAVHIFVDASGSMDWGTGEQNKFTYALKLAAALGMIALSKGDHISVLSLGNSAGLPPGGGRPSLGPLHGSLNLPRLLSHLSSQIAGGHAELGRSLQRYSLAAHRPGLAFLISDLLTAEDYRPGLAALQSRGYELTILHLLSPDELDPPLAGDLRLVDVETGNAQEVSLDSGLRGLYRQRLQEWQDEIKAISRARGIHYLPVSTGLPWDKLVLQELRKTGVVK